MKRQTSSFPADDATNSSKTNNQETLQNGCVCPFGCEACDRLAEAFEAMREALQQFLSIYPEKVRAHPDVRIACTAASEALALADKVTRGR